jgi:ribulose-phosphate 3-epimerase
MSVMAGFGGQEFMPEALGRLRRVREMAGPKTLLSVDGGIHRETIGACAEAGADVFVCGSALFSQKDYGRFIEEMTSLAAAGNGAGVL